MLWALKKYPNQHWLSEDFSNAIEMILLNDTYFKKWLDRYKYFDRYPEYTKEYYRKNCCVILNEYEQKLNKTKYFISKASYT